MTELKFSEVKVGEVFYEDGVMYEKLSDGDGFHPGYARGPRRHTLGTGVYDFELDDEVEEA